MPQPPSVEAPQGLRFADLPLDAELLAGLDQMGYHTPTDVQAQAIPAVATGKDFMVQARTGTGKTLAFGLPALMRIDRTSPETQVLVICPTRELALQVRDELARVADRYQILVAAAFGGVDIRDQYDLVAWAPIIVGTPGRLRDLLERNRMNLSKVRISVLDEADEMLDMGFKDDLEFILSKTPAERQSLLFSATFPPEIVRIAQRSMRNPEAIHVSSGMSVAAGISHKFVRVPKEKRIDALAALLKQIDVEAGLIFCNTKVECAWVHQKLRNLGVAVGIITGDVPQEKRLETLAAFRESALKLVVATDVAARGLDIPHVSHVFHFSVPVDPATYVHRSGRTGRAGKAGVAYTLVIPESERDFQRIMAEIKPGGEGRPQGAEAPRAERQERGPRPERGGDRPERGERHDRGERPERAPRPEGGQAPQGGGRSRHEEVRAAAEALAQAIMAATTSAGSFHDLAGILLARRDARQVMASLVAQTDHGQAWQERIAGLGPAADSDEDRGGRRGRRRRGGRGGREEGERPGFQGLDQGDEDDAPAAFAPAPVAAAPAPAPMPAAAPALAEAPAAPAPRRTRTVTRQAAPVVAPMAPAAVAVEAPAPVAAPVPAPKVEAPKAPAAKLDTPKVEAPKAEKKASKVAPRASSRPIVVQASDEDETPVATKRPARKIQIINEGIVAPAAEEAPAKPKRASRAKAAVAEAPAPAAEEAPAKPKRAPRKKAEA